MENIKGGSAKATKKRKHSGEESNALDKSEINLDYRNISTYQLECELDRQIVEARRNLDKLLERKKTDEENKMKNRLFLILGHECTAFLLRYLEVRKELKLPKNVIPHVREKVHRDDTFMNPDYVFTMAISDSENDESSSSEYHCLQLNNESHKKQNDGLLDTNLSSSGTAFVSKPIDRSLSVEKQRYEAYYSDLLT